MEMAMGAPPYILGVLIGALTSVVGCSSSTEPRADVAQAVDARPNPDASLDSTKPPGSEGGPCYGNGTCDADLVCASNLCVRLPDAAVPRGDASPDQSCASPRLMYPDSDGDGFGSVASAGAMLCPPAPGYVDNNEDCADGDPRAHPRQMGFFGEPVIGPAAKRYDFNCDGVDEPDAHVCDSATICSNRGYTECETPFAPSCWGTEVQACGVRKIVESCTLNGSALDFTCDPVFVGEVTQPCR